MSRFCVCSHGWYFAVHWTHCHSVSNLVPRFIRVLTSLLSPCGGLCGLCTITVAALPFCHYLHAVCLYKQLLFRSFATACHGSMYRGWCNQLVGAHPYYLALFFLRSSMVYITVVSFLCRGVTSLPLIGQLRILLWRRHWAKAVLWRFSQSLGFFCVSVQCYRPFAR